MPYFLPANSLLGIYSREMKTYFHKETCTWMFTAALFTIAKTWKQPPNWWMDKQNMVCSYYWAIKRNGVMTPAATWVNPQTIMFSERSQIQKTMYCSISFIGNIQKRQIIKPDCVIRMVAQNDKLTKKYWTVHSEQVNFMICNHTSVKPCYSQCVCEPVALALLGISSLEKQSLRSQTRPADSESTFLRPLHDWYSY